MFVVFTNFLIFLTGSFSLIMAAGTIAVHDKKQIHYVISLLFLSIGVISIHFGLETTGLLTSVTCFMNTNVPFVFLLGPLLYYYFRMLVDSGFSITRRDLLHGIPAAVAILLLIPYYIQEPSVKINLCNTQESWQAILIRAIYIVAVFSIVVYTITVFIIIIRTFGLDIVKRKGPPRIIVILSGELILLFLLMFAAQVLQGALFWRINYILAFQVMLTVYILGQRYPHFLQNFTREASRVRYERTQVRGIDINGVIRRLNDLMIVEKIYADEEVTLESVSKSLSVTPHQLSEILNEKIGRSFRSYINEFRINEAKRLLKENSDMTILRIAYESGFGSKTSFNTLFQKATGMTPGEYRAKKHGSSL